MNDCNPIPCTCVDGSIGLQGLSGPKGSRGAPGSDGAQGPQGEQGLEGEQGVQGFDGEQGDTGPTTTGVVGDTGQQGAIGNQGPQGTNGLPGTSGFNGTDGQDGFSQFNFLYDTYCGAGGPSGCPTCSSCGGSFSSGSSTTTERITWNFRTGPGFSRVDFNAAATLGTGFKIYSDRGASKFKLRSIQSQMDSIEITAYNSTTNNKVLSTLPQSGSAGGGPYPEGGLMFEAPNGSDCIEVLYVGDGEWVVIQANLAGNVIPTTEP